MTSIDLDPRAGPGAGTLSIRTEGAVRYAVAALIGVSVLAALSSQEYLTRHWAGGPRSFNTMLLAQCIGALVWLGLTPAIIAPLTKQFPLRRPRLARTVAAHAGAGLVVATLHTLILAALFATYYYGISPAATWDVFRDRMHTGYAISVLLYFAIVALLGTRTEPSAVSQEPEETSRPLRRVLVKADGRTAVLPVAQIDWIEAADNNVIVHSGNTRHSIRGPLSTLALRLPPARFARIHRSTVVNLESVREVQPWYHGDLVAVLKDETRLRVGRTYQEAFLSALEG